MYNSSTATQSRTTLSEGLVMTPSNNGHRNPAPPLATRRGGDPPLATAMSSVVPSSLREENDLLQKKVKYLQSVGMIFRQRIALMIRDCSKEDTEGIRKATLSKLYSMVMSDAPLQGESDLLQHPSSLLGDGGGALHHLPSAASQQQHPKSSLGKSTTQHLLESRVRLDEVRKSHQMCLILQEKNALKEQEAKLKSALSASESKCNDLQLRHARLVEYITSTNSQSTAADGSALVNPLLAAQKEFYECQIRELQLRGGEGDRQPRTNPVGSFDEKNSDPRIAALFKQWNAEDAQVYPQHHLGLSGGDTHAALQKQNTLLRHRVSKLKALLDDMQRNSLQNAAQLDGSLQSLLGRIEDLQSELNSKDCSLKETQKENLVLSQDIRRIRHQNELYVKQIEALQQEFRSKLELEARKRSSTGSSAVEGSLAERRQATILESSRHIAEQETTIRTLQTELAACKQAERDKDLQVQTLGIELKAFRDKMSTFEKQQEQKQLQSNVLVDVKNKLMQAVEHMHQSKAVSALHDEIKALSSKIVCLESIELQLRQREDALSVAEDENSQLRRQNDALTSSLRFISSLYGSLPTSISDAEKIVIELEEHKKAVIESVQRGLTVDVGKLQASIELAMLKCRSETEAHRLKTTTSNLKDNSKIQTTINGPTSRTGSADPSQTTVDSSLFSRLLERGAGGSTAGAGAGLLPTTSTAEPISFLQTSLTAPRDEDPHQQQRVALNPATSITTDVEAYLSDLLSLPPPPVFSSPAASTPTHGTRDRHESMRPSARGPYMSPGSAPTHSDVALTFDLFDENQSNMLPLKTIKLCLSTLGLNHLGAQLEKELVGMRPMDSTRGDASTHEPLRDTQISKEQFLALCLGKGPRVEER